MRYIIYIYILMKRGEIKGKKKKTRNTFIIWEIINYKFKLIIVRELKLSQILKASKRKYDQLQKILNILNIIYNNINSYPILRRNFNLSGNPDFY